MGTHKIKHKPTKLLPGVIEFWKELTRTCIIDSLVCSEFNKFIDFIQQAPKPYMFVPCDGEGNVLRKPDRYDQYINHKAMANPTHEELKSVLEYQQALDRVIFDGFEVLDDHKEDSILFPLKNGGCIYYYTVDNTWKLNHNRIKTIGDLAGKVLLNKNGIKDSGA